MLFADQTKTRFITEKVKQVIVFIVVTIELIPLRLPLLEPVRDTDASRVQLRLHCAAAAHAGISAQVADQHNKYRFWAKSAGSR